MGLFRVARPRARGLGLWPSLLFASVLGLAVVGAAWLKAHHLGSLAHRADWQTQGFVLQRPAFDRLAFERTSGGGFDPSGGGAYPETLPQTHSAAQREFLQAMDAYLRGDDRGALSGFNRVVRREPHWPAARFYLGVSNLLGGHPVAAVCDLQAARDAAFSPPDGPCEWWLGIAQLYNGERAAGRRCLSAVASSAAPQAAQARKILEHLDREDTSR
jgi:hypothetical protein